jgi:hypothetical protein
MNVKKMDCGWSRPIEILRKGFNCWHHYVSSLHISHAVNIHEVERKLDMGLI